MEVQSLLTISQKFAPCTIEIGIFQEINRLGYIIGKNTGTLVTKSKGFKISEVD
jgi:hypothetical protein